MYKSLTQAQFSWVRERGGEEARRGGGGPGWGDGVCELACV